MNHCSAQQLASGKNCGDQLRCTLCRSMISTPGRERELYIILTTACTGNVTTLMLCLYCRLPLQEASENNITHTVNSP